MDQFLEKLKKKQNLTFEESKSAFKILMTGMAIMLILICLT